MEVTKLNTLKFHRLTKDQYDAEKTAGTLDGNAIYIIRPDGANSTDVIGSYDKASIDDALGAYITDIDSIIGTGDIAPIESQNVRTVAQTLTDDQKSTVLTNIGAASQVHEHSLKDDTITDVLPLNKGGTGTYALRDDAPANAIVRKANDGQYLFYTGTNSGALYAVSENGVPTFGTLPVGQGGTGQKNVKENVSISVLNGTSSSNVECKYFPYLDMCWVRAYIVLSAELAANTNLTVCEIDANYKPQYITAISAHNRDAAVSAYVRQNSTDPVTVIVSSKSALASGSAIYISGWWMVS